MSSGATQRVSFSNASQAVVSASEGIEADTAWKQLRRKTFAAGFLSRTLTHSSRSGSIARRKTTLSGNIKGGGDEEESVHQWEPILLKEAVQTAIMDHYFKYDGVTRENLNALLRELGLTLPLGFVVDPFFVCTDGVTPSLIIQPYHLCRLVQSLLQKDRMIQMSETASADDILAALRSPGMQRRQSLTDGCSSPDNIQVVASSPRRVMFSHHHSYPPQDSEEYKKIIKEQYEMPSAEQLTSPVTNSELKQALSIYFPEDSIPQVLRDMPRLSNVEGLKNYLKPAIHDDGPISTAFRRLGARADELTEALQLDTDELRSRCHALGLSAFEEEALVNALDADASGVVDLPEFEKVILDEQERLKVKALTHFTSKHPHLAKHSVQKMLFMQPSSPVSSPGQPNLLGVNGANMILGALEAEEGEASNHNVLKLLWKLTMRSEDERALAEQYVTRSGKNASKKLRSHSLNTPKQQFSVRGPPPQPENKAQQEPNAGLLQAQPSFGELATSTSYADYEEDSNFSSSLGGSYKYRARIEECSSIAERVNMTVDHYMHVLKYEEHRWDTKKDKERGGGVGLLITSCSDDYTSLNTSAGCEASGAQAPSVVILAEKKSSASTPRYLQCHKIPTPRRCDHMKRFQKENSQNKDKLMKSRSFRTIPKLYTNEFFQSVENDGQQEEGTPPVKRYYSQRSEENDDNGEPRQKVSVKPSSSSSMLCLPALPTTDEVESKKKERLSTPRVMKVHSIEDGTTPSTARRPTTQETTSGGRRLQFSGQKETEKAERHEEEGEATEEVEKQEVHDPNVEGHHGSPLSSQRRPVTSPLQKKKGGASVNQACQHVLRSAFGEKAEFWALNKLEDPRWLQEHTTEGEDGEELQGNLEAIEEMKRKTREQHHQAAAYITVGDIVVPARYKPYGTRAVRATPRAPVAEYVLFSPHGSGQISKSIAEEGEAAIPNPPPCQLEATSSDQQGDAKEATTTTSHNESQIIPAVKPKAPRRVVYPLRKPMQSQQGGTISSRPTTTETAKSKPEYLTTNNLATEESSQAGETRALTTTISNVGSVGTRRKSTAPGLIPTKPTTSSKDAAKEEGNRKAWTTQMNDSSAIVTSNRMILLPPPSYHEIVEKMLEKKLGIPVK